MAEPVAKDQAPGRDLNSAIASCFSPYISTPPFHDRFVDLVQALTNTRSASIWHESDEGWNRISRVRGALDEGALIAILEEVAPDLSPDAVAVKFAHGHLAARVALPGGTTGVLLMPQPAGNAAVQGITFERISLLTNLSFIQFRHPDVLGQRDLFDDVMAVAAGQTDHLQPLIDRVAQLTGAEVAAVGLYDGSKISGMSISGQDGITKRAELPKRLRQELTEAARLNATGQDRFFAQVPGQDNGIVLLLEGVDQPTGILPLTAAIYGQAAHRKSTSKWSAQRFVKLGAVALVLFGVAMIPIPDGVDLPARVEASTKRILTAPFTGIIADVNVTENARVAAEDVMVRMDTREIELELIGVLAERANAVVDREAARAARNAAQLRNAELEVERLQARIDLLDARKTSATLTTSISGIAVLGDLTSRVGTTVRQGETLMEVADPSALHLDVTVLESNVGRIAAGDTGTFRPDFNPSLSEDAEVAFISPAIDLTQDPPRLNARATFASSPETLGPGLSGVLILGDSYRPIWQVVYTNLHDWLLLRFWL